jgi:hypothetical protein
MRPQGYNDIKRMATEKGWKIDHLLALSSTQDPYYAGVPNAKREAEWFLSLWNAFDQPDTTHLRRFHYLIVSSDRALTLADGSPYQNTHYCWDKLISASGKARHLGLVNPLNFDDHRNPDPQVYASYYGMPEEPWWRLPDLPSWGLPFIRYNLASQVILEMPSPEVGGYEYSQADQPYHLEVWVEKSTMNDILAPICRELHVNLVPGVGFQSITSAIRLLQRVHWMSIKTGRDKPVIIFYISDFDPAGVVMPIGVARQAEFYLDTYAPGANIKLTPLALTEEQVRTYDLPRIPIKVEDARKGNFEDRRGEGAVELDALEALHPGELGRIVRGALQPYVNESLADDLAEAEEQARQAVEDAWEETIAEEDGERVAIEQEAREICERYEERAAELNHQLQAELAPLKERIDALTHALATKGSRLEIDLPCRPSGSVADDMEEETEWLFDSSRDYLEQMAVYRKFKKESEPGGVEKVCARPGCNVRFRTDRRANIFCCSQCRRDVRKGRRAEQARQRKAKKVKGERGAALENEEAP